MTARPSSTKPQARPLVLRQNEVASVLLDKKTQHRLPIKLIGFREAAEIGFDYAYLDDDSYWQNLQLGDPELRCPLGQIGDLLWVRERWYCSQLDGSPVVGYDTDLASHGQADYRAVLPPRGTLFFTHNFGKWRSPMHMPRWASRILLEITNVRIEPLDHISPADARAEGPDINGPIGNLSAYAKIDPHIYHYAREWEKRYHPNNDWYSTWVWVIEFKRAEVL
jgi:hypothetical protein